jgi:hypothetical protein
MVIADQRVKSLRKERKQVEEMLLLVYNCPVARNPSFI